MLTQFAPTYCNISDFAHDDSIFINCTSTLTDISKTRRATRERERTGSAKMRSRKCHMNIFVCLQVDPSLKLKSLRVGLSNRRGNPSPFATRFLPNRRGLKDAHAHFIDWSMTQDSSLTFSVSVNDAISCDVTRFSLISSWVQSITMADRLSEQRNWCAWFFGRAWIQST